MVTAISATPVLPAWRPIATGPLARELEAAVDSIAVALRTRVIGNDFSLAHGELGIALFFLYRGRVFDEPDDSALAVEIAERALDDLATARLTPSLFDGWFGTGCVVEHVARLTGTEVALDEMYAATRVAIDESSWHGRYGLASGLVGAGVYARERGARGGVIDTLAKLAELADMRGDTATWLTPPRQLADLPVVLAMAPDGCYDFSLSQGIPGVIAFLAHATRDGYYTRPLLEPAVRWLLAHALPSGSPSTFSRWWFAGPGAKPARNAWCTGDPGVATALLLAATALDDANLYARAIDIARAAAARPIDDPTARVQDAGLCHGAAGLAHVFNRLAQRTGDRMLAGASRAWLARLLDMRSPKLDGLGGFRALVRSSWDRNLEPRDEPGLLVGAAGIGLAMLAAISDIEPEWDRFLLLS